MVRWAQYWELFTDGAPNSGKGLEKAKLITIWVWAVGTHFLCLTLEEFKTIVLGKKGKILTNVKWCRGCTTFQTYHA